MWTHVVLQLYACHDLIKVVRNNNIILYCKSTSKEISHTKYPKNFRAPLRSPQFFSVRPLTWNPGSAPDINLNMYIINVITDDESKIGLYEI